MNRIYQGQVTAVELSDGKEWKPFNSDPKRTRDFWQDALWQHHELFQDAVNYYTLALAAMAEGVIGDSDKAKAARGWREQVQATWRTAKRRAMEFSGPHKRVAPLLGFDPMGTGFEDCAAQLIAGCMATKEQRAAALLQLLEEAAEGDLNQMAVARLRWLCAPKGKLDATPKSVVVAQEGKMLEAIRAVHEAAPATLAGVIKTFEPGYFVTQFPKDRLVGTDACAEAERLFKMAAKKFPVLAPLQNQFAAQLNTLGDSLSIAQLGRKPKGTYALAVVLKLMPTEAVAEVFRKATESQAKKTPLAVSTDCIAEARVRDLPLFDYFTNIAFVRDSDYSGQAVWFEFDLAAFLEAIKAPHRYFQDTQKREKAADELRAKLASMRGRGGKMDDEHEEEDAAQAVGFEGDVRIKLLEELVMQELGYEAKVEEQGTSGEKVEYTIQERTLRGFADVKKKWCELAVKGQATEKKLLAILADEQTRHRDDFGSATLYQALAKPKNHPIWKDSGTEKWHAEDPLKAWRAYTELRFELEDKTRPIRFTPAHAISSPRYFIIPKAGRFGSEHCAGILAFTCGIVLHVEGGWKPCAVRVVYSAPRLFRDELRIPGDTNIASVPWFQPMMKALGLRESDQQDFSNCRITLQPNAPDDIQLTFPVEITPAMLTAFVGKAERWNRQFNVHPDGDKFCDASLRWPHEKKPSKPLVPWHDSVSQFSCLSVDLGQRDAGAFAMLEACANNDFAGKPTRFIGETPNKKWRARLAACGMLRLSGEDRIEWRAPSPSECKRGENGFAWREELWGERGRNATLTETDECARLFANFGCEEKELLHDDWRTALSFPEQNDKLLIAARRAQSRLARLHRWCWFLADSKQAGKIDSVLAEIEELDDERVLPVVIKRLAKPESLNELLAALRHELDAWSTKFPDLLVTLANRCLPLRGRSWAWAVHPKKQDCFLLSQEGDSRPNAKHRCADGTEENATWIRGQRGLSFERVGQIEELRKRFQSLNQFLRRSAGGPPPKRRDDSIPDPCPDLLDKLDRLKEQRVNQTAHLILAEALGVKLAPPPANKAILRASHDQHGAYERVRPPVDFIIIEDLSRYRASQGRAPRENSRLMKWCHRAVRDKLKQLCEVFGLPVLDTPAAYSSRFCARSGVPGFRAVEVTPRMEYEAPWRWLKDAKKDDKPTEDAEHICRLIEQIKRVNIGRDGKIGKWRTLLAPLAGGPIFIPICGHIDLLKYEVLQPAVVQADINASINLGLRAVADPRLWTIHPRLRTQRAEKSGTMLAREKRKFGDKNPPAIAWVKAPEKVGESERNPNFFADFAGCASWETARVGNDSVPLASGKALWSTVKQRAWERIHALNASRIDNWKHAVPDEIPM